MEVGKNQILANSIDNTENKEVKNEITNNLSNNIANEENIEKSQNRFLESTFGKIVNTGLDLALRAVLPNAIEDHVIGIKNTIFNEGLKSGIRTAVDSAINLGKSAVGIVTGKFDSVSQAYTAVKAGGIIDSTSKIIDNAVKSAKKNGLINNTTATLIKRGKNVVKDCISSNIEKTFMEQIDGAEKVGKYINNWNNYLEQRDLSGMNREYTKIKKKLETLMPIESTIKQARIIENLQILIKSKGNSLENITQEEINLAKLI